MKITEVISELVTILKEHGDLPNEYAEFWFEASKVNHLNGEAVIS